jgi:hypothetical protein
MKLAPAVKRTHRFTMNLSSDELKHILALAKLAGENASTVVRTAVRREYHTKIVMKRQ